MSLKKINFFLISAGIIIYVLTLYFRSNPDTLFSFVIIQFFAYLLIGFGLVDYAKFKSVIKIIIVAIIIAAILLFINLIFDILFYLP